MNTRVFPWFAIIVALLGAAALACSAGVTLPQMVSTLAPEAPNTPPSAGTTPRTPGVTATKCPHGDCASACLAQLSSIVQNSGSSEFRPKVAGQGPKGTPAVTLVTYALNGDQLGAPQYADQVPTALSSLQHDTAAQQKIWDYFAAIIPTNQRAELTYYIVSTDGRGGMLASVEQFSGRSENWALVVDPADAGRPRDLTFTLLHEFGHLITLNSSQVKPDEAVLEHPNDLQVYAREAASCPRYFATGGCSLPDSYINRFFDEFWTKIYAEWSTVNAGKDQPGYMTVLGHFYRNHATQFITPYASTSPEEDMAETWAYFLLNPKPGADSVAHRKVLFFYGFPELVDLRNQIISNLCTFAATQ